MTNLGRPASSIRPEGNAIWVIFGIITALTFTLLGERFPCDFSYCLLIINLYNLLHENASR